MEPPPPPPVLRWLGVFTFGRQVLRKLLERATLVINAKKIMIAQLQVCVLVLHVRGSPDARMRFFCESTAVRVTGG